MMPFGRRVVVMVLGLMPLSPVSAQEVPEPKDAGSPDSILVRAASPDSISVRFIDAEVRTVVQALGRLLAKPVLTPGIGDMRLPFFETPVPVPRSDVLALLRGIVEAHGLEFREEPTHYSILSAGSGGGRSRGPAAFSLLAEGAETRGPSEDLDPVSLFTVHLKHARAAEVAATLNQLYEPPREDDGRLVPGQPQRPVPPRALVAGAALSQAVTIVPDEPTNTLLIRASGKDFAVLREGIEVLDLRPLQVLIEVIIVEVRKDRSFSLGMEITFPEQKVGDATVSGELTGPGLGNFVVRVLGLGKYQIDAILTAARGRGDVSILSRPVIFASNNEEASLMVGTQRPFVAVSRSLPTDIPQRDQVVEYRDVGTRLTVLPTINHDGYVSLLIDQEISNATDETQFDAPIISTREAQTRVLVGDGQTIVIGGMQDRVKEQARAGVPILSDIPILGHLFGSTKSRTVETELFLFITPSIIRDDAGARKETLKRLPEGLVPPDSISPPEIRAPGAAIMPRTPVVRVLSDTIASNRSPSDG